MPKVQTPGEESTDDDSAAKVASLELENRQLLAENARLTELLNQPVVAAAVPKAKVQLGADWSSMTSTEAKAKGCTERVLCSDGWYVPAKLRVDE